MVIRHLWHFKKEYCKRPVCLEVSYFQANQFLWGGIQFSPYRQITSDSSAGEGEKKSEVNSRVILGLASWCTPEIHIQSDGVFLVF